MEGRVVGVSRSPAHTMSKVPQASIQLLAGLGVDGDVHAGKTVQHLYHIRHDPNQPNQCQIHLIQAKLYDELRGIGYDLSPGQMGENVTTRGMDLLGLPAGTRLHLGLTAVIETTGLRTPCRKVNGIQSGLMAATQKRVGGKRCLKAALMAVVIESGEVRPGDAVRVALPPEPHRSLKPL